MKLILIALALTVLAACGAQVASDTGYAPSSEQGIADARVIAVMSHADWCPSCKIVEPLVESVRANADLTGIAFTEIDYTDKNEAGFFAQSEALGVGEAIERRFGEEIFTGRMVLVDADTQQLVGEIDKTMDADAVLAAFQKALSVS